MRACFHDAKCVAFPSEPLRLLCEIHRNASNCMCAVVRRRGRKEHSVTQSGEQEASGGSTYRSRLRNNELDPPEIF